MRLIDADALMETIRACEYPLKSNYTSSTSRGMFTIGIQQVVDEQPTVAVSPWHRVEEELPKYGEYVLAWEIQGFAVVDKYVGIGDGRWDLENEGAIYTHWMPMPEPPKEEE